MALLPRLILSHLIYLTSSIDSDCNFNIHTGGACTPLTILEKQAILDLHNELRDRVAGGGLIGEGHPAATNMNSLIWDDGLASVAQTYAESCPEGHNDDRYFQIKNERDANNTKWGTPNGATFSAAWCGSPSWNSTDETCIPIGENWMAYSVAYTLSSILTQIETGWWDEYTIWSVAGGGLIPEGHPAATNMNSLIWDDGLANVAQMHLEKSCEPNENVDRKFSIKYERDEGNTKWGIPNGTTFNASDCGSPSWSSTDETCIPIGENLMDNRDYPIWGISYNLSSILTQIETEWWNEYTVWTYGMTSAGCAPNGTHTSCGHYTQMAWANTRYVGCGYVNGCSNVGWIWDGIFVCNYFPVGNFNGASYPPYTAATSNNECSDCDRDRTECKSMYVSQSTTAGSYADQPYDALCDGGACPVMCDGSVWSVSLPYYCNSCMPQPSNIDCTDGTDSISGGRHICATPAPATPAPVTPTPTTPAPISYPNCGWKKKYATTWSGVSPTWTKWYDGKVKKGRNEFLTEYPGCHTSDASSLEF
eukprot:679104_1